ncbi:MAG: hypothetical protein WC528_02705 [Patescibacteria group bacterium]
MIGHSGNTRLTLASTHRSLEKPETERRKESAMFYLWRNGETEQFMSVGGELEVADPTVLDGQRYDYGTAYVHFPVTAHREQGLYRYKTAEASLKIQWSGQRDMYFAMVKFVDIRDAKKLFLKIMGGLIWPEICYEKEMCPSPMRHLRQLFREAWEIIRRDISNKYYGLRRNLA